MLGVLRNALMVLNVSLSTLNVSEASASITIRMPEKMHMTTAAT